MNIELIAVESGWLGGDRSLFCEGASGPINLPVQCWVVRHPRGTVLFDTGLHGELVDSKQRLGSLADLFSIDMQHDLGAALRLAGVDAADINLIVFSHLHFDHSGGTAAIPNAAIVVQAAEWRAGHDDTLIAQDIYNPADFDLGHDIRQVSGEHDLFGDGRVVCLPTPGHTAGHQSLRVELNSGPLLLVGDCCYWQEMLDRDQVPPFGYDTALQRDSMALLRRLHEQGVRLVFGHDAAQWRSLRAAGVLR